MNKKSSPFRAVQSKLRACRRTLCFQERFNANGAQLLKPGSENKPKWNIPQVFLILLFCGVLLCFGPCGTSLDLSLGDAAFCQNMASSLHQSGSQLWVLCLEALSVSACNWQHLWLRYTDDQEWQIWQGMGWIDRQYQLTACALNSELVYARFKWFSTQIVKTCDSYSQISNTLPGCWYWWKHQRHCWWHLTFRWTQGKKHPKLHLTALLHMYPDIISRLTS